MDKIRIETLVLGAISTNCYVVTNQETKETVIIDPADEADRIHEYCNRLQAIPVAVLLTHGHFDHIGAAQELREEYHIPVYAMEQERETLASEMINLSVYHGVGIRLEADTWLQDGQVLELAGLSWHVLFTPGHTLGGCCYYVADWAVLFSGDTLFQGSVGRTDFYGGSMSTLVRSLREKLLVLPEETVVYPGHGPASTIGWEKQFNPYR